MLDYWAGGLGQPYCRRSAATCRLIYFLIHHRMPKKGSHYSSSEGARHRSSGSNARRHTVKAQAKAAEQAAAAAAKAAEKAARTEAKAAAAAAKVAGRCTSRRCGESYHPNGPGTAARYTEKQCIRYCPPGSTSALCSTCEGQVGNPKVWHGVMGGPLPPYSHIRSEGHPLTNWNAATQAKEQAKAARATRRSSSNSAGNGNGNGNGNRTRRNKGAGGGAGGSGSNSRMRY